MIFGVICVCLSGYLFNKHLAYSVAHMIEDYQVTHHNIITNLRRLVSCSKWMMLIIIPYE